jgi:hypothetical protein
VQNCASSFAFLGFSFRWRQSKKGTPYVHTEPSPAAEQALPTGCANSHGAPPHGERRGVVREINQMTRGWGNYFALAHYHRSFGEMNHLIALRLRQWLWRKHGNPSGKYQRWPDHALCRLWREADGH